MFENNSVLVLGYIMADHEEHDESWNERLRSRSESIMRACQFEEPEVCFLLQFSESFPKISHYPAHFEDDLLSQSYRSIVIEVQVSHLESIKAFDEYVEKLIDLLNAQFVVFDEESNSYRAISIASGAYRLTETFFIL